MSERIIASRRENALKRYRSRNDPVLLEATRNRKQAALIEAIKREAESDPPLSMEQRSQLAILLLRPSGGQAA
jgi:hypothetical protein